MGTMHIETRLGLGAPIAGAVRAGADVLFERLGAGFPPGAAAALVDGEGVAARIWGGWACLTPERIPMSERTRFDLASLTKVTATTSLAMLLRDRGCWRLEDPVARWVRGFPTDGITLWHCLTHTSGLPAHRPFYRLPDRAAMRRALFEEALKAEPPGEVVYSDLNFILLGWALAACTHTPLRRLSRNELFSPLGMAATDFRPPARSRRHTAATEVDGDQRRAGGAVWGEVHDGNAFAMGGVAGHAGLFAPLDDMAVFVAALLRPGGHPVLSASAIADMTRPHVGEPPNVRGLGWRLGPAGWGPWPRSTFWHTGFTGTSLLVAPDLGVGVVLLTNAVHPRRRPDDQAQLRADFHGAVAEALRA